MDERAASKLWVEHWQRVGPLLEKIRHDELRALTEQQAALAFESLAEFARDASALTPRISSGFVEQQRLFKKLLTNGSPN
ncbi:MAG TPA: hypothetical protein VHU84_11240 [Lacipirellulaceae bacterium]|jgi:hypothetical protein|nr:hypothetical protein [Lacipirellulaceae bacterium]